MVMKHYYGIFLRFRVRILSTALSRDGQNRYHADRERGPSSRLGWFGPGFQFELPAAAGAALQQLRRTPSLWRLDETDREVLVDSLENYIL